MDQANELEVLGCDRQVYEDGGDGAAESHKVRDQEGAVQVGAGCLQRLHDFHREVHAVQVDEEGDEPQRLYEQVEDLEVNGIVFLTGVEIFVEDDSHRTPEDSVSDHDSKKAVPSLDRRSIGVELVPREIFCLWVLILIIGVEIFLSITILI